MALVYLNQTCRPQVLVTPTYDHHDNDNQKQLPTSEHGTPAVPATVLADTLLRFLSSHHFP